MTSALQTYARFGSATGPGITNAYDGFGRLTSSTSKMDGTSRALNSTYDPGSRRTGLVGDSGYTAGFGYDAMGRLTAYNEMGTTPIVQIAYDAQGRRSHLYDGIGAVTSSVGYGYDQIDRLALLTHDLAGTGADQSIGFSYSPASQIVARSSSNDVYAGTAAQNVSRDYARNGLNQYTGRTSNGTPSATFAYDANGNLTSDGSTNFVYDAENRLVSASGAKTASLAYDPLGRLWQTGGGSQGTTRFLYDGDRLVIEYDGAGAVLRSYVHGAGADEPLVWYEMVGGFSRRFPHADHQGSIVAIAALDGSAIAINGYDPWGIPNATNLGRFQYTGQVWIAELGMYYYKARFYSPTLGRFMQTDPIGYADQINLYGYVGNDPVNKQDPSGLCESIKSRICAEKERQLNAARQQGVRQAWKLERELVARGGGTRPWTRAERSELLRTGKVKGYEGHHINTVNGNPIAMARNPRNIQFVTRGEHLAIHRIVGGFRAPISGKPMAARSVGWMNVLTSITGVFSGRIRTDNWMNTWSDLLGMPSPQDEMDADRRHCESMGFEYELGMECA